MAFNVLSIASSGIVMFNHIVQTNVENFEILNATFSASGGATINANIQTTFIDDNKHPRGFEDANIYTLPEPNDENQGVIKSVHSRSGGNGIFYVQASPGLRRMDFENQNIAFHHLPDNSWMASACGVPNPITTAELANGPTGPAGFLGGTNLPVETSISHDGRYIMASLSVSTWTNRFSRSKRCCRNLG